MRVHSLYMVISRKRNPSLPETNSWRLSLRKGRMLKISRSTSFGQPIIFQANTINVHEG